MVLWQCTSLLSRRRGTWFTERWNNRAGCTFSQYGAHGSAFSFYSFALTERLALRTQLTPQSYPSKRLCSSPKSETACARWALTVSPYFTHCGAHSKCKEGGRRQPWPPVGVALSSVLPLSLSICAGRGTVVAETQERIFQAYWTIKSTSMVVDTVKIRF